MQGSAGSPSDGLMPPRAAGGGLELSQFRLAPQHSHMSTLLRHHQYISYLDPSAPPDVTGSERERMDDAEV